LKKTKHKQNEPEQDMEYTPIQKGRLADKVSQQLKESIFQGHYKPGERVPPELELVQIFGVSRVIVREAVRNLEQAGLLEIKRGSRGGAFVLPMKHDSVFRVLKDVLRLGRTTVADLMEVRLGIEPIVAGLAAERVTVEDLEMLSLNLQGMAEVSGDDYVSQNVNFHRLIARCAHNPMYDILINILMDFTEELVLSIKPSERIIHDKTSHPGIVAKVQKGDSTGAQRIMRSHLEDIVPPLKELERERRGTPAKLNSSFNSF